MDPFFLTLDDVLIAHGDLIDLFGGDPGLRDLGLLESALAQPMAGAGGIYAHPDLFSMAAAYLFHIVRNHPFVDGNKRTALVAALLFLGLNGVELETDDEPLEVMVWSVARNELGKEQIASWLRERAK